MGIDLLRPFLRHKPWCNAKTDDDPNTERCKCGLRAALATHPEPGEDGLRAALMTLIDECYQRGLDAPEAAEFIEARLRAAIADAGLVDEVDRLRRLLIYLWDAEADDNFIVSDFFESGDPLFDDVEAERARLAATPTEPDRGTPDYEAPGSIEYLEGNGRAEPDASFDDPVLEADPAPTWKGGLLGTEHG